MINKLYKSHKILILSILFLLFLSILILLDVEKSMIFISELSLWVREYFGTFYLYLGLACVLFMFAIAISPLGKKRLGKDVDRPEYSLWTWFCMLYSTGMGSGILLRAVQEPVYLYVYPPLNTHSDNQIIALQYTFYQWGFTPWAFYGFVALVIGWYVYRENKKIELSAIIQSEKKQYNQYKLSINILAVLTTVFGVVSTIALGSTQIAEGIQYLFPKARILGYLSIAVLLLISGLAMLSALTGIKKGIKFLSNLNISLALFLMFFVVLQGNIIEYLYIFFITLYHYFIDFIPMSLSLGSYNPGKEFLTDWTYYYWAFWLAWAPFTGVFIARISRGRTLREFILGILFIPSLGSFFWFTVFGKSAFNLINVEKVISETQLLNVFSSIFIFFEYHPFTFFICIITLILLILFLVTSIDSAIYVLGMFSDKGNENPSKKYRFIWGIILPFTSILLIILSYSFQELNVLQVISKILIIVSLPFSFYMLFILLLFLRDLIKSIKN